MNGWPNAGVIGSVNRRDAEGSDGIPRPQARRPSPGSWDRGRGDRFVSVGHRPEALAHPGSRNRPRRSSSAVATASISSVRRSCTSSAAADGPPASLSRSTKAMSYQSLAPRRENAAALESRNLASPRRSPRRCGRPRRSGRAVRALPPRTRSPDRPACPHRSSRRSGTRFPRKAVPEPALRARRIPAVPRSGGQCATAPSPPSPAPPGNGGAAHRLPTTSRRCSTASSPRTPMVRRSAYTRGHGATRRSPRVSASRLAVAVGNGRRVRRPPSMGCRIAEELPDHRQPFAEPGARPDAPPGILQVGRVGAQLAARDRPGGVRIAGQGRPYSDGGGPVRKLPAGATTISGHSAQ